MILKLRSLESFQFVASRSLPLRNLDLGYGCGRVFPAGVGPDSP